MPQDALRARERQGGRLTMSIANRRTGEGTGPGWVVVGERGVHAEPSC
jgi:hypothetical protein